jgi:hypothetical protein
MGMKISLNLFDNSFPLKRALSLRQHAIQRECSDRNIWLLDFRRFTSAVERRTFPSGEAPVSSAARRSASIVAASPSTVSLTNNT